MSQMRGQGENRGLSSRITLAHWAPVTALSYISVFIRTALPKNDQMNYRCHAVMFQSRVYQFVVLVHGMV
jgi:hypothetical protein